MRQLLLVVLPSLHAPRSGAASPQWTGALRLWPGLPDVPQGGRLCPGNYPFSPREAAACMEDLRLMGEAALSGLPVGATVAGNAVAARAASEAALLEGLGASRGDAAAARAAEAARRDMLARQQAQKTLLWAWQQEERLGELAGLAERFTATADGLTAALGVEPDENMGGGGAAALTDDLARLSAPIVPDAGLAPSWRTVAANALFFLPPEAAVALEGEMREDALDLLDFTPAPRWGQALSDAEGVVAVEARAPGRLLLGRTRPTGQAPLDAERLWVAWRRAA